MTALDLYYKAISDGNIPAAVPVEGGLTTVTFTPHMPDVHALATGSQQQRAKLAVFAVNAAYELIADELPA